MTEETAEIRLNGVKSAVKNGTSVKDLLHSRGINPNTVACELNLSVVKRKDLDAVTVKNGDVLEIIRMIGGG